MVDDIITDTSGRCRVIVGDILNDLPQIRQSWIGPNYLEIHAASF